MVKLYLAISVLSIAKQSLGVGFRTVGSSGCAAQMAFVPPFTDTIVFLDNYHPNYGGLGVNLTTGAHSKIPYRDTSGVWTFGAEFDWKTNKLRQLKPKTNTFCSAGAFLPDGTMLNMAGSEPDEWQAGLGVNVPQGFDSIRTYAPGPCIADACAMDFDVKTTVLQSKRWYPTAEPLINGDVVVVGGSNVGLLVLNEASINVPTYEFVKQGFQSSTPVALPILQFNAADNLNANKSYNLYPILALLPNTQNANQIFTIAGNQVVIWDYTLNKLVKTLPVTPLEARCFPSSASAVLLPLVAPNYEPTMLLCGGSSGDMPDPQTLNDCYTIKPNDANPVWIPTDNLPNGGQVMSDAILLPDGQVLLINGAHKGSAGGYQADEPVLTPLIYNNTAAPGSKFTAMPKTTIPRMYHSVAQLLASGEILVAGSNPDVFYSKVGSPSAKTWPYFNNNGHRCAVHQQQSLTSSYPTEYRVEIFSPPYMDSLHRPVIGGVQNQTMHYSKKNTFGLSVPGFPTLKGHVVTARLISTGFRTHGMGMGQRAVELLVSVHNVTGTVTITAPRDATVITPGVYLLFVVVDNIPSEGLWIQLK